MSTNVPLMIGWRYVRAKRRNQFISFISGFSLIGMAVGVMALIIVMSVLNGFDGQIKDSILKVIPHGTLSVKNAAVSSGSTAPTLENWRQWAAIANQHPRVLGAAPYVKGIAAITGAGGSEGVEVHGVLPSEEINVSVVDQSMRAGELGSLQAGEYNIILGRVLASVLFVTVGDTVRLTTTELSNSVLGPRPLERTFTVSGIFETGGIIDQSVAIIHIEDAKKIYRLRGGYQGLRVKVDDIYAAPQILREVAANIDDDVEVQDWSETQGSLFQAVKQEKLLVGILQMTIIAIAALNIVTGLVLMVADKRADIAVLRTMGLTARQVLGLFMVQGTSIGLVGLIIGVVIGCVSAYYFSEIFSFLEDVFNFKMFDPNVYYTSILPSELRASDVIVIAMSAFVLSVISTIYPAFRASQVAPAEALRYE